MQTPVTIDINYEKIDLKNYEAKLQITFSEKKEKMYKKHKMESFSSFCW